MLSHACFDTARSALSFCKNMCRWCCYAQGNTCDSLLIVKTLNERKRTLRRKHTRSYSQHGQKGFCCRCKIELLNSFLLKPKNRKKKKKKNASSSLKERTLFSFKRERVYYNLRHHNEQLKERWVKRTR
jgi:hypothetical protein